MIGKPPNRDFKTKRVDWWISHLNKDDKARHGHGDDERKLREKDELIRLLLDSTPEAIYSMDLEGNCTLSNPVCTSLLGFSHPEELLGSNMHTLIHHTRKDGTPYPAGECPITRTLQSGIGAHVLDDCFRRLNGTCFDVEYWSYPVRRDGALVGAVVTFFDITDRLKDEDSLRQSQKMEAIGQLAGGVAHDFNNLLIIITGYSELLLHSLGPDDASRKGLEEIKKAGERSASLTRQLLEFTRKQVPAARIINLNKVVRDTDSLLQRIIGEDVRITTVLHPRLNHVKADAGQIEQVLLNLAINARDAMPKGGKITIRTDNVELGPDDANAHTDMRTGHYVMLAVTDSGEGMTPQVKERIFEPFFTTKADGKGTGLGLAVVHGVVKRSDGCIEVFSEPGVGTSFKVYLPQVEAPPRFDEVMPGLEEAPRGTETILLAEDEPSVRALISTVLQDSGYSVLESEDVDTAVSVAAGYPHRIHLLVTDVVMPGGGGRVLADKLVSKCPELKVLFLSGYTDDSVLRHGILQDTVDFMQKPFTPSALAQKVREILSRPTDTLPPERKRPIHRALN